MAGIGVAVAGAGFIGPVHVEALRRNSINVVGILGVDEAESKSAAAALGLAKAYKSFDEVLADDAVQAVHLAVPNNLHYSMAKQALAAGKHVMCEKPLAMNSQESAELVELAAGSGLAAGVNHNLRFYPLALEARDMRERGDLGDVFHICGSYVQDWLFKETDYNWRVLAEEGGASRAVADVGTHWMDLVRSISGLEVESLCADLKTVHPVRRRPTGEIETFAGKVKKEIETEPVDVTTEDYGAILFHFKGGATGLLWASQVTAGRKNMLRYEIAGSKCALSWNSERPNELWIGHRDEPNEVLTRDPALLSETAATYASYPGGHCEGFPDTFKQHFKAFYDYIEAGDMSAKPTFATFADGHREIVLCEAILRSNSEGGWVKV